MGGGGIFGKLRCVLLLLFLKIRGLTHPQYIKFLVVFVLYVNKRNGRDVLMWCPPLLSVFKNALPPIYPAYKIKRAPPDNADRIGIISIALSHGIVDVCKMPMLMFANRMPLKKKKIRTTKFVWDLVCASLNTSGKMQFKHRHCNA